LAGLAGGEIAVAKKITGKIADSSRRKLESVAATKFGGGVGRATIHIIKRGLKNPDESNTMDRAEQVVCSVNVEDDLIACIVKFQGKKGIAKKTDATKLLIELGLSVIDRELTEAG
jgi:hypothetical protein